MHIVTAQPKHPLTMHHIHATSRHQDSLYKKEVC